MSNYVQTRFAKELVSRMRGYIARWDVSQVELAALCQVSQSQFSKMIRGVRPITIDQVAIIAEALDLELVQLVEDVSNFVDIEETRTSPVIYVENGRRLDYPNYRDDDILDAFGMRAADAFRDLFPDVGGAEDTSDPRSQDDHRLAAKKRSANRGEEDHN